MEETAKNKVEGGFLNGFSPVSSTPTFWKSRRRSSSAVGVKDTNEVAADGSGCDKAPEKQQESPGEEKQQEESSTLHILSEKRKALFEPLEPTDIINRKRASAELLLPPPDFESTNYPKGWLIGKKRKLVNVDVVESMRRIAVQEMNRKDREIDGLNEQLDEDARCLEHLQLQLLEEKSKRADVERQNTMLQNQITMLMDMIQENEAVDEDIVDDDDDEFKGV